jgi:hypothetical protein
MRVLAIGLAIAVIVFVVSGGHVLFLPLLFLPLGLFSLGHRRRRRPSYSARDPIVRAVRRRRSQNQLLEKWLADFKRLGRGRAPKMPGQEGRWRRWLRRFASVEGCSTARAGDSENLERPVSRTLSRTA